jgi:hypothetical protein
MSQGMPAVVPYGPHEVSTKTEIGKHLWSMERKADYNPQSRQNMYPRMLYKAYEVEGVVKCMDTPPKPYLYANQEMYRMACENVDHFNISCQKTVGLIPDNGPSEQATAEEDGWRTTPEAAKAVIFALKRAITHAAMERAAADKNMSEKARVEIAAAEAETPDQIGEIREKPAVKKVHWKTAQKAAKDAASAA